MLPLKRIVGLGEVLWDVFPDGPRFGGAPANFACSAAGLGGAAVHVSMVTAVGRDEPGRHALQEFQSRNVDTGFVEQQDRVTGQVLVTVDQQGQPSYRFLENTAWDHLTWSDSLHQIASVADAVCFGTLGQRSEVSRSTIRRFVSAANSACLRIFDINLRPPYWTESVVLESLPLASVLKLNSDELTIVSSLLALQGSDDDRLLQLLERFPLQLIVLTRGAGGSLIRTRTGERSERPGRQVTVVDTVGAGDAFTAALTVGLLHGCPLNELHDRADRVATFVCTQPGATPTFPKSLMFPQ